MARSQEVLEESERKEVEDYISELERKGIDPTKLAKIIQEKNGATVSNG